MPRVQSIQELVPLMLAASPGALRVLAHPGPQPPFQLHRVATALVSCGLLHKVSKVLDLNEPERSISAQFQNLLMIPEYSHFSLCHKFY